ncbi:MAG: tRNA pseudouridine(55) synthase TruB [Flavobacteriales bacterium]|jgi:tRNA pseudouridine55 synthase|tara:strand:- start:31929 stop:32618 length:690 start_codon:yes stop_codon:yes gene_type:complete
MEKIDYLEGNVVLINKPLTWTSFDVVKKVRNILRNHYKVKKIKVGHAGTLDPLADGLLILCTGKWTKKIEEFQNQEKEYTGTFVLGATTPSYDLETEVDQTFNIENLTKEKIESNTDLFTGDIEQAPPVFSALKKDGVRLYEYARKGIEVEVKKRNVHVRSFEITRIELPEVDFKIACSKGTYIRSIAHDFGKSLENGAHLSKLTRTKIGAFQLEEAIDLDDFENMIAI